MPVGKSKPWVAIEPDVYVDRGFVRTRVSLAYAQRVTEAGGVPVVLSPEIGAIPEVLDRFDALVLTGGDDPRTEPFGVPTDPRVTPIHEVRQSYVTALLITRQEAKPAMPVLGVCLGMQMMALAAGGTFAQFMPESHPDTHATHWDHDHEVLPVREAPFGPGTSHSRHKQCVLSPGSLRIAARAPDGIVEAIHDPDQPYYLGVQWHPERTADHALGQSLFDQLVAATKS